jgi:hypothetical protein
MHVHTSDVIIVHVTSDSYKMAKLRWLDIVITNTLLKNCEPNRVTIFTRRSRKLINKIKELPKWPDVSSCSRHITPLRVFYRVLCQLLTSLPFSILEKQCAVSLYFVWWPMFKFCMLYCTAKNLHFIRLEIHSCNNPIAYIFKTLFQHEVFGQNYANNERRLALHVTLVMATRITIF